MHSPDVNLPRKQFLSILLGFGIALVLLLLFAANRPFSKLSVGPIYIYDVTILLALPFVIRGAAKLKVGLMIAALILILASIVLLFDLIVDGFAINTLRRYGMAVYMVTPFVILSVRKYLVYLLRLEPTWSLLVAALCLAAPAGFQGAMAANVLASLFLMNLFIRRRRGLAVISAIGFMIASSGVTSEGDSFRVPVLGLLAALSFAAYPAIRRFAKTGLLARKAFVLGLTVVLLALLAVTFVERVQDLVGQMFFAAAGLLGSEELRKIGLMFTDVLSRSRGDAVGTGATRMMFWRGVVEYAIDHPKALWVGNGHSLGFFERVFPTASFRDAALLEPHNSLLGFFYRYGLIGSSLLIVYLAYFVKKVRMVAPEHALLFFALGFIFAFFEVALESPHGAVIFWCIVLMPWIWASISGGANNASLALRGRL